MSSENQTNIRFSLKETVWFQKGQEVKEVRSLSLNPDITIQQFDEYVQVKGVLTLEGNYTPDLANQGDYYSLRELAPSRLVENVIALEDGSCELNHQFPVDISIPLTRITDLENLCVSVETFDYQLAEKGSIQIAADLCISGLHDNNRAVDTYHEQNSYEQYNNYTYNNDYRSSNEEYEQQEQRAQEEQFQFFHQPTSEQQANNQDNLYGSDWIQSLEDENEQEDLESTYPQQPTYLEVFQPEEVVEERIETVENEAEHYYELDETNEQSFEEEQVEEQFEFEVQAQSNDQSDTKEEEYEEMFRGFNISTEAIQLEPQVELQSDQQAEPQAEPQAELQAEPQAEPQAELTTPSFLMNGQNEESSEQDIHEAPSNNQNNTYNERPSFLNNEFNVHSYLDNTVDSRPSFLNNDYSTLQNYASNENNAEKEIQNYEEQYNRSLEQSYQPYVNQQYQQAPFAYNQNQQQPFYQNQYPQVNQDNENSFGNPNDVRQTPPYYAEYYQAHVGHEVQQELPKEEVRAVAEVKAEASEVRSVKSDNLLSSLFTGEGREESYSKLKLYLAQNGDTIESVAKKYNLQTQQLNRVNNLSDEFLSEGQIIYIPVTAIKQ